MNDQNKREENTILMNTRNTDVLVCIMNNSGINTLKIAKKTKIPQASVYRAVFRLIQAGLLTTMTKKPGWKGGNSTIMYSATSQKYHITVSKKGVMVVGLK